MTATQPRSSGELDLTLCDREPIHIPGSIQPYGFLLALDKDRHIRITSANAPKFLGLPMESLWGRSLGAIFGERQGDDLLRQLDGDLSESARMLRECTLPAAAADPADGAAFCDVVAYRTRLGSEELTCLEFEPVRNAVDIAVINARLHNFVAAIRRTAKPEDVYHAAVAEIHALTGCDRVLLYNFNEEGHGVVLAEERSRRQFASYLHLRFPASDIPRQARRLYEVNRVRIIPDVDYEEAALVGPEGLVAGVDLSGSTLRSVSPVHRQYMRNMGTTCSMSVSLIIDNQLWGLISCHHRAPRYLSLRLRSACDFIAQIAASQIEAQQNGVHLRRALRAKSLQSRLLAGMAAAESYVEGLKENPSVLADLVGAAGIAIVSGAGVMTWGETPDDAEVLALSTWLREQHRDDLFVTDALSSHLPQAAAYARKGSGLIAASLSRLHTTQVLWFRPEMVHTVRWAGNPQKPVDEVLAGKKELLSPRHSFEDWSEVVRGRSDPWMIEEVEAARDFRASVLEIVLRRAEELAGMAADLQVANEELEAFSYSVSHDLRAPFRHISGFSEMLKENESDRLSERGRHYLETIMESARFAGQLVDSLLEFARVGRSRLHRSTCSMERIVDSEWKAIVTDHAERSVEFTRGPLPEVEGDPQLLRQVWRNLLENAVKYTARRPAARVRVEGQLVGEEYVFSVADNGVGFDQQYAGKLFGVFQRLHRIEEFEGTGIGLANVRRIISRHGGRAWAEGAVDVGATFFFSLPVRVQPPGKAQP